MTLLAKDCSPIQPSPTPRDADWLGRLAAAVRPEDHVVDVTTLRDREDDPVVYCERDGRWRAGRYVGSLTFEGRTLVIHPRFGMDTLRHWLTHVGSLVVTDTPGQLEHDSAFIAPLLALLWSTRFDQAARHGLPTLRRQVSTRSPHIRGRLDVAASLSCFAARNGLVVSTHAERSLTHAASNAIVAAYESLRRQLGVSEERWIPARVRDLAMQLRAETGPRPPIPSPDELRRVRYTPITRGFEALARLSRQIAVQQGLRSDADGSRHAHGVLLDVAELWESFVVEALRRAVTPYTVTHGTRESAGRRRLLQSEVDERHEMGTLIPDALIHDGARMVAVADAKYKRLHPTPSAPWGPQREDLYQMAAYLTRFSASGDKRLDGLLLYPDEASLRSPAEAARLGPWRMGSDSRMHFVSLPIRIDEAVAAMRGRMVISGQRGQVGSGGAHAGAVLEAHVRGGS